MEMPRFGDVNPAKKTKFGRILGANWIIFLPCKENRNESVMNLSG